MGIAENRLRRKILLSLYEHFKHMPLSPLESGELARACETTPQEFNWNVAYLEMAGYVGLHKYSGGSGYAVSITVTGIDLVEDGFALKKRFALRRPKK